MKKHILIIDDELDIAEAMASVLESEGFSADAYSSGVQALQVMKKKRPDLLIMDVMMPSPRGTDVVKMIRSDESIAKVPILLMSASKEPVRDSSTATWDRFIRKPFDLDELLVYINELLV